MKKIIRILALIVSFCLLLSCFPANLASAEKVHVWPPEGKTEAQTIGSPNLLSCAFYYGHYTDLPSGCDITIGGGFVGFNCDLLPEIGEREQAQWAQVSQVSGDDMYRNAFSMEQREGEYKLVYNAEGITADGISVYQMDVESEHCWSSFEFTVSFVNYEHVTITPKTDRIEAAVGDELGGWDWANDYFDIEPNPGKNLTRFLTPELQSGERETEEYRIDQYLHFWPKEPGDYPMMLRLELGMMMTEFWVPVQVHVVSKEEQAAQWEAAWPPKGKTEAVSVTTHSIKTVEQDLNGTYFINGEESGIYTFAPYYLVNENGEEDEVREFHVKMISGDEHLRDFFSPSKYSSDSVALSVPLGSVHKAGKAEFRIDMVSNHYYTSVIARPVIMDSADVKTELISSNVNVKVGETASIRSMYEDWEFVKIEPTFEYECGILDGDDFNNETDEYKLEWGEFTAKKPGDYQLRMRVTIYDGFMKYFTINVHASEDVTETGIAGDAPRSAKAIREEQEERERKISRLTEKMDEGDSIAETENAIFLYSQDGTIKGILPQQEHLIIPSDLEGTTIKSIDSNVVQYGGSSVTLLTIEDGIETIGGYAFSHETELERVELPDSVTSIGRYAFRGCRTLKEIKLPAVLSADMIELGAFESVGTETIVLGDGTDLMALSLERYRKGGSGSRRLFMTVLNDDMEYIVREDSGAIVIDGYIPEAAFIVPESINGHPVREIADRAFSGSSIVESLVLPEGLERIGNEAFYDCENLKDVQIPSTVTAIGSKAFDKISAEEILLPEGASEIASDWFLGPVRQDSTGQWKYQVLADGSAALTEYEYTEKLDFPETVDGYTVTVIREGNGDHGVVRKITFPDTVRIIEESAFSSTYELKKITLPANLEQIEKSAFSYSGLQEVTFPESLRFIGEGAFMGHQIREVIIPAGVREIGNCALIPGNSEDLKSVTFLSPTVELGIGIFGYDDGYRAFMMQNRQAARSGSIDYDRSDTNNWIDYYAERSNYSMRAPLTVKCYSGSTADILYQYNVKKEYLKWSEEGIRTAPEDRMLAAGLYQPDELIFELIIPEGVEEIADSALAGIRTLNKVQLPSTIKKIGSHAFDGCSGLKTVTLPKGLEEIGEACFKDCCNLTNINLPDGITVIPDNAFEGCKALAKVSMPKAGLQRIGQKAFYQCEALSDINLGKALEEIGESAFEETGLKKAVIPNTVASLGKRAFACSEIASLTLPKALTEIPDELCYGVVNLKSVKLPASVTKIGCMAFSFCRSLADVSLPEGLISIGEAAFAQNADGVAFYFAGSKGKKAYSSLKKLKLPASLQTIENNAFSGNDALTSITFAKNAQLEEIGNQAFALCVNLKDLNLPDSVKKIGDYAFAYCYGLKKADIGKGVTEIGREAFGDDSFLTSLTVPDTLVTIGEDLLKGHGENLIIFCSENSTMGIWLKTNDPDVKMK